MAEEAASPKRAPGGRPVIIIATVVIVVLFTIFLMGIRSCSAPSTKQTQQKSANEVLEAPKQTGGNVVIYSNLDLKDAAAVITRLKELKIPYQIKDEGHAISVSRNRADEARLGLAEKNLPSGGSVGWEIFDQSKLGATDFDRRIQFIRAISGELSRTINRISSVQDSRVQIVIPETQLFQATTSPVTASVLLKLNPGMKLTPMQIDAIVYLVSGSVENLRKENVTIIDTDGNILAGAGFTPTVTKPAEQAQVVREEIPSGQPVETTPSEKPEQMVIEKPEEKAALEVQTKLDLEDKLTSKVQSILNKLYPPNITIAKVNIDSIKTRKITVIILIDKKFKLERSLKQTTFDSIAAATGYDKERGDKIIMKSVVFRAVTSPSAMQPEVKEQSLYLRLKSLYRLLSRNSALILIAIAVLVLSSIFVAVRRGSRPAPSEPEEEEEAIPAAVTATPESEVPPAEIPVVVEMKNLATQNPEQVAELIKTWLAEEGA